VLHSSQNFSFAFKYLKILNFICPLIHNSRLKLETLNYTVNDGFAEMGPQYGHAFGHALEAVSNYELLHVEAIAIGMFLSAEVSYLMGLANKSVVLEHYELFRKFGLPVFIPDSISNTEIMVKIKLDKHWSRDGARLGLVDEIGNLHGKGKKVTYNVSYG
jgi:3-dehydroquinate synthase